MYSFVGDFFLSLEALRISSLALMFWNISEVFESVGFFPFTFTGYLMSPFNLKSNSLQFWEFFFINSFIMSSSIFALIFFLCIFYELAVKTYCINFLILIFLLYYYAFLCFPDFLTLSSSYSNFDHHSFNFQETFLWLCWAPKYMELLFVYKQ